MKKPDEKGIRRAMRWLGREGRKKRVRVFFDFCFLASCSSIIGFARWSNVDTPVTCSYASDPWEYRNALLIHSTMFPSLGSHNPMLKNRQHSGYPKTK
jgi:hypothetical protein